MLIRSGLRAVAGDDISFLKADGIQLFSRIITSEMAKVHGKITRGSGTLLKSGWPGLWEEVEGKTKKLLLFPEFSLPRKK